MKEITSVTNNNKISQINFFLFASPYYFTLYVLVLINLFFTTDYFFNEEISFRRIITFTVF